MYSVSGDHEQRYMFVFYYNDIIVLDCDCEENLCLGSKNREGGLNEIILRFLFHLDGVLQ